MTKKLFDFTYNLRIILYLLAVLLLLVTTKTHAFWPPDMVPHPMPPEMPAEPDDKICNLTKNVMYIGNDELKEEDGAFRIHIGGNIWIETKTIHRDYSGLYTYESDISELKGEYIRTWKCPYCNHYWPIGKSCKNKDCPSRYKD